VVRRKSLRVLSVALAVVVAGSALYYGASKYISADVSSDGAYASIKDPSYAERRVIIYDAYISNRKSGENFFEVAHNLYLLEDDLINGKLTKVPVDSTKKYTFWKNYWTELSGRTLKVSKADSGGVFAPQIARAASSEAEIQKWKKDFQTALSASKLGDASTARSVASMTVAGLRSGKLTVDQAPITPDYISSQAETALKFEAEAYTQAIAASSSSKVSAAASLAFEEFSGKLERGLESSWSTNPDRSIYTQYLVESALEAIQLNGYTTSGGQKIAAGEVGKGRTRAEMISVAEDYISNGGFKSAYIKATTPSEPVKAAAPIAAAAKVTSPPAIKTAAAAKDVAESGVDFNAQGGTEGMAEGTTTTDTATSATSDGDPYWYDSYFATEAAWNLNFDGAISQAKKQTERSSSDIQSKAITDIGSAISGLQSVTARYASAFANMKEAVDAIHDQPTIDLASGTADVNALIYRSSAALAQLKSIIKDAKDVETLDGLDSQYGSLIGKLDVSGAMEFQSYRDQAKTALKSAEKSGSETSASGATTTAPGDIELTGEATGANGISVVKAKLDKEFSWSKAGTLGINPNTGNFEYTSKVYDKNQNLIGTVSFDPIKQTYSGYMSWVYGDKDVKLYSQPLTGDVYAEISNSDSTPLLGSNNSIGLFKATISRDGSLGGQFKFQNRVFNYNANTKAFEIPININHGINAFTESDEGGMVYLDTNGNVRGAVQLLGDNSGKSSTGTLYFDRTGNLSFTYDYKNSSGVDIAGVTLDSSGNLAGTINAGRALGLGADVLLGLGSGGLNFGGTVTIGSSQIPLYFSPSSGTSIGIPGLGGLAGISIGKDGISLNVPIIGQIHLFGGDDRPDCSTNPATRKGLAEYGMIPKDDNNNLTLKYDQIYICRSINGGLRGHYEKWNKYTIESAEQKERSARIFKAYNDLLKRNPTQDEYISWYFFIQNNVCRDEPCDTGTAAQRNQCISYTTGRDVKFVVENGAIKINSGKQSEEYKWIAAGNDPTKAPGRPGSDSILTEDPLNPSETTSTGIKASTLEEFYKKIKELGESDAEFKKCVEDATCRKTLVDQALDYAASQSATATATSTAIVDGSTVSFAQGFSTFVVPESLGYVDGLEFTNKGLELFKFDTSKASKWATTYNGDDFSYLKKGIGYYVYNPSTSATVTIKKASVAETQQITASLSKGWNLVANSTASDLNLSQINHSVVAGEQKTLVDLATAGLVYQRIYLIQDGTATEADKAFKVLNPLATDVTTQVVGSLKPYWVYVK